MCSEAFIEQDSVQLSINESGELISIQLSGCDETYLLAMPCYQSEQGMIGQGGWNLLGQTVSRLLRHKGQETTFLFRDKTMPVSLAMNLRLFPGSPFIRFRYVLESDLPLTLTKESGQDQITYSRLAYTLPTDVSEIQFSQFDPHVHSFVPHFQPLSEASLNEGIVCPGPILLMERANSCSLLAYEHGAEYPDAYLAFSAARKNGCLDIALQASKGNYYDGQQIGPGQPLTSPWFHYAVCTGDKSVLLKAYRRFFLEEISENMESRKPYLFYNTWNNQERNKYIHHLPYLHSMNLEHTLAEIDSAARLGVDVFVIDTGWYNKTGDWIVNSERFPDGLRQVRERLDQHGMKLGLWFNPIVAAETSAIMCEHPEYRMNLNGQDSYWGKIWETEESWGMCLASGYSDHFIRKMIELNQTLGVTYFKWDAIGQYGCNSPHHHHGNEHNSAKERLECYSYQMGLEMIRIVEEVHQQCPDVIVDFDITEGARFVGLGFLSVGKYFLMNNGPYYSSFDIPAAVKHDPDTINVFFFPGAARARVCRQGIRYDHLIPSILFLTHFLPDKPVASQNNSLASLVLGGNGIWGDLSVLDESDISHFGEILQIYKQVAPYVTKIGAKTTGFIGSSPEIYEKLDLEAGKGIICFFTRGAGTFVYHTDPVNPAHVHQVSGADAYEITAQGRLKITVILTANDARIVFVQ